MNLYIWLSFAFSVLPLFFPFFPSFRLPFFYGTFVSISLLNSSSLSFFSLVFHLFLYSSPKLIVFPFFFSSLIDLLCTYINDFIQST